MPETALHASSAIVFLLLAGAITVNGQTGPATNNSTNDSPPSFDLDAPSLAPASADGPASVSVSAASVHPSVCHDIVSLSRGLSHHALNVHGHRCQICEGLEPLQPPALLMGSDRGQARGRLMLTDHSIPVCWQQIHSGYSHDMLLPLSGFAVEQMHARTLALQQSCSYAETCTV